MNQYKVLVVEDDLELMKALSIRIRWLGHDVVQAMDGYQAVNVALKEQPNVVLLDIGLPAGDGLTVMSRFAALPTLMSTPVVVLSGRDPATIEAAVRESGAVAFLRKPVDNGDLDAALHAAINGSADGGRFWDDAPSAPLSPRVETETR
jgi:two-component system OmpR family response regulator